MNKKSKENQVVEGISSQKVLIDETAPRLELLESLSAMMDDEAEALEVRRVVKTLDASTAPELLGYWRRLHAARATLQQDQYARPNVDLLAAVQAGIAKDKAPMAAHFLHRAIGSTTVLGRVMSFAGQGLIAASVALAVLVAYPGLHGSKSQDTQTAQTLASATTAQQPVVGQPAIVMPQFSGDYNASALTRTVSLDDAARHRLENAVRNFSGTAAVLKSDSMPMFPTQLEPFAPAKGTTEHSEQQR